MRDHSLKVVHRVPVVHVVVREVGIVVVLLLYLVMVMTAVVNIARFLVVMVVVVVVVDGAALVVSHVAPPGRFVVIFRPAGVPTPVVFSIDGSFLVVGRWSGRMLVSVRSRDANVFFFVLRTWLGRFIGGFLYFRTDNGGYETTRWYLCIRQILM